MPTLTKNTVASAVNPNPNPNPNPRCNNETQKMSKYEQSREERIKENRERMQKLGIVDISLQIKSNFQPKRSTNKSFSSRNTSPSGPSLVRPPGPVRRSSRLQKSTPVSYSEVHLAKKEEKAVGKRGIWLEEGAKPEVYTEEHKKLLGDAERSWTLFVDGYGKDGKRIYDPVKGKTCHQCRQKTLGHHTNCSQCNKVQGQFCGDCLYMRYGEHVLEANENPDWICPVCRGICNCSLCRTAKGWPPTGMLYKKISQLGFKSVAHYLIHTQRSQTNLEENRETTNQVSAKRSLDLPAVDTSCEEILKDDDSDIGMVTPLAEIKTDDAKSEKGNDNKQTSAKRSLSFPDVVQQSANFGSPEANHKVGNHLGLSKLQSESSGDDLKCEKENKMHLIDIKLGDSSPALVTSSNSKVKPALNIESSADSIGARLRKRRRKGVGQDDHLPEAEDKISDDEQDVNKTLSEKEAEIGKSVVIFTGGDSSTALGTSSMLKKKHALAAESGADSIGGRLRQRRRNGDDQHDDLPDARDKISDDEQDVNKTLSDKEVEKGKSVVLFTSGDSSTSLGTSSKLKKNRALAAESGADSIGGRLRQRRRKGDDQHDDLPDARDRISDDEQDVNKTLSEKEAEKGKSVVLFTGGDSSTALGTISKLKKKHALAAELTPDSIAGRLRQRRKGNSHDL